MFIRRISGKRICMLFCCLLFASCSQSALPATIPTRTPARSISHNPSPTPTRPSDATPARYTMHLILSGLYRPDDLAIDPAGHLVFSDVYRGTISRLNANGSVSVLLSGLAGPEGLVFLANGTLIIAEQQTNRILALAPSSTSLTVLRILPGTPSRKPCKDGVDGIALDPTTQTLIIPDSPTGNVYRMSLDGKKLTLLATHIPRPVGAAVDSQGNIYVADECGGALWKIPPSGQTTRIGGFGMLDDIVIDRYGNLLVTDLKPSIHALIRVRMLTGKREILARQGFIEPQGLVVDAHDNIFLSDDFVNKIVEYIPRR